MFGLRRCSGAGTGCARCRSHAGENRIELCPGDDALRLQLPGKPLEDERVVRAIESAKKKLGKSGRLVIRPSGTEPVIRVMAEGDDAVQVERIVDSICDAVRAAAS